MRTVGWAKGLIKLNLYASRDGAQPTKPFRSRDCEKKWIYTGMDIHTLHRV